MKPGECSHTTIVGLRLLLNSGMALKRIAAHQVLATRLKHFSLVPLACPDARLIAPDHALAKGRPARIRTAVRICPPCCDPNITDKNHLKATRPIAQELNEAGDRPKFFLYHNLIVFHA